MAKRIPVGAKMAAYDDAIGFLIAQESDSDEPGDREARHWLADKLDKECDRWVQSLKQSDIYGGS